jgi:hypothetical protein
MFRKFIEYYGNAFLKPRRTFELLLLDNSRFSLGFFFMLIPVVFYTVMYVMLTIGEGAPSTFTPWLNITKEHYYFYNQFLLAPSLLMSWFLAAGVIQVLSRLMNGKGSFEDTLTILGLSISVALWSTLVHDLAMSFLSAIHVIDAHAHEIAMNSPTPWRTILWCCFLAYFIWFPLLFAKGIAAVHKLKTGSATFIGFIGFIVFQLVFLIFNR